MKRLLALVLVALLLPACALAAWQDGVYMDKGAGYHDVLVTCVIRDGKIESVQAEREDGETNEYHQKMQQELLPQLVEKNGVDGVDTVSGATGSSQSVLDAMAGILKQAEAGVRAAADVSQAQATPRPALDPAKARLFAGLGSACNFRVGPGKDETGAPVYSFNVAMAEVVFDQDGVIQQCTVDVYEVSTPNYDGASMPHFSGWPGQTGLNVTDEKTGKVTGEAVQTEQSAQTELSSWRTKRERGDDYGMNDRADWHEQMDAYQQWMIGQKVSDLRAWFDKYTSPRNGRPIKPASENEEDVQKLGTFTDEEKQMLADVTSMATMSLSDGHGLLLEALEKAYENRVPVE